MGPCKEHCCLGTIVSLAPFSHRMLKYCPIQRQQPEYSDVKSFPMSRTTPDNSVITNHEAGLHDQLRALPIDPNLKMALVSRVVHHLLDTDNPDESREKAYSQGTAAIFVYVCDLLEIEHGDVDKRKRNTKHILYDRIVDLVCPSLADTFSPLNLFSLD